MMGANKKNRLFQCLAMYALGNSTPMANTPMARTTRVNSNVIAFVTLSVSESGPPPPHPRGLKRLVPYGPMTTPNRKAQQASPMYSCVWHEFVRMMSCKKKEVRRWTDLFSEK